ncbi:MAG: DUF11 domain-containing protein [Acidobacteriia bacterium]|nr:DUF11 domain-containing protein [Terriglobia bacterium]
MDRANVVRAAAVLLALCSAAQATLPVTAIAAGGQHSVALTSDGTVWSWGPLPEKVRGLQGAVAIAAGYTNGLALRSDGTVWQWEAVVHDPASGFYVAHQSAPFQVPNLSGVVRIAGGSFHSLALRSDGTVWEWPYQRPPVQVSGVNGVIAIAAGQAHSLALKNDGTVWAWGNNMYGQLGDGTFNDRGGSPAPVTGLARVTAIAAGYGHSLALKSDGTVWTWGVDGTVAVHRLTPEQVRQVDGAVAIAAGMYTSAAARRDGTVWEWGQFGSVYTTPVIQAIPVPVNGLAAVQAVAMAAGDKRSLALTADGTVWEWGSFRIMDALRLPRLGPHQVTGVLGAKAVAAGGAGALALNDNGSVWQWSEPSKPIEVGGLADVAAIAMGSRYNTALRADGSVWEWIGESAPAPVSGLTSAKAIAAAGALRLAVESDGTVWEWNDQSAPAQVNGLSGVVSMSVGLRWDFWDGPYPSPCLALGSDGTVWKWSGGETPQQVWDLSEVSAISAGETGVALRSDGTVWEWNWGPDLPTMPLQVGGLGGIVAVAVGSTSVLSNRNPPEAHRLALKEDGTVWAWGDNRFGQLGDGTNDYRTGPVQVGGLSDVAAIGAAAVDSGFGTLPASFAVKRDGTVWAWGFQEFGRFDRSKPVQLIPPGAPDLVIAMSHAGEFSVGDQGIYILALSNTGWAATSGTITVTDTLPPGLTFLSGSGDNWACSAAGRIVTCTKPDPIAPGVSSTIILRVSVDAVAWPGVTNLATVENSSDPNTTNNTTGDPTVVRRP